MESENKKPELIIIAGPNGSGKTTVTQTLLKHEWAQDALYINPDDVAQQKFGDWNSNDAVIKAAQFCQELRYQSIEKQINIVFETVMSSQEKIDYIRYAKEKGYFIRLFFVCTDAPEINAARIAKRYMDGGHCVPIEKIVSRYYKALNNLNIIFKEVDRCYFYDNSVNNEMAKILFRTENGRLAKQYASTIPDWAKPVFSHL